MMWAHGDLPTVLGIEMNADSYEIKKRKIKI
jgi:hypothetical protein